MSSLSSESSDLIADSIIDSLVTLLLLEPNGKAFFRPGFADFPVTPHFVLLWLGRSGACMIFHSASPRSR
jgi:hypothetical protein